MDNIAILLPPDWPDFVRNSDPIFLGRAAILEAIKQWSKVEIGTSRGVRYQYERLESMSSPLKIRLKAKKLFDKPGSISINPAGFYYNSNPVVKFPISLAAGTTMLYQPTTMSCCGGCRHSETVNCDLENPLVPSLRCRLLKNTSLADQVIKPYSSCILQTIETNQFEEVLRACKLAIDEQVEEANKIMKKINDLSSMLKSLPKKPTVPYLRGKDYFTEGKIVYVYIGDWIDYLPEFKNTGFFPCIVLEDGRTKVLFEQKVRSKTDPMGGYADFISHWSYSIIDEATVKALRADLEYAKYWASVTAQYDKSINPEKFLASLENLKI